MSAIPTTTARAKVGVTVSRYFTKANEDPYAGVNWTRREAKITERSGRVVFQMDNVEAPDFWSQAAVDIAASKYFRKAGVPGVGHESSIKQLVHRVAHTLAREGIAQGLFDEESAQIFEDELKYLLVHQYAAFNSPVWFNCGLKECYGITGSPSGNWAVTAGVAKETPDSYSRPALSACFIQTVQDNLMDIAEAVKREMRVFKGGGGSGMNYSNLRAEGEALTGGGQSSGMMSFLEIFDKAAGATKSGGTTRRAARMVVVNADHPDIESFIDWKVREEKKVAAMVKAGYSSDFQGDAYRTVSGQNANNSVRVTDEFMRAVETGGKWSTVWRTTGKVAKTYEAKALFRQIATAAHFVADPGMQFDTTTNRWNPTPNTGRINASNPCAEFTYLDNTACNLASLNLVRFMSTDERGVHFDVTGFQQAVDVLIAGMDLIVDYASYPTREIATNSHMLRPLGIGYANLGAMLMRLGLPYDGPDGRSICAAVTALMTGRAYRRSAEIAGAVGPFAAYAFNCDPMLQVIDMHSRALDGFKHTSAQASACVRDIFGEIREAAADDWNTALALGNEHGFRNAQASLLAPTGTIGLLMDCDTTGIEPDFALVKSKKLAGGGDMKIVNKSIATTLVTLGYNQGAIDRIMKHLETAETIEGSEVKPEHLDVFDCAVKCGATGVRCIRPMAHVEMMAAAQPFLSGAISKTVNCPEETTVEEIEALYMAAWRLGLKAIAVFRDRSKLCAILSSSSKESTSSPPPPPAAGAAQVVVQMPKRQRLTKRRYGFTQEVTVGGHKLYLRTGEYKDGALGEIFIDMHKEGALMRSLLNSFAIAVSLALQHGVPLEEFVDAFVHTKFEPKGIVNGDPDVRIASSILDYIFKTLGIAYLGRTDLAHHTNVTGLDSDSNGNGNGDPGNGTSAHASNSGNGNGVAALAAIGISSDSARETLATLLAAKPGARITQSAGEACGTCGNITVRAGSCSVCPSCGTTTGCG